MTPAELQSLLNPDRQNGVLLDANLLVLLWVGRWSPKAILHHKRTNQFDADDFALLEQVIATFRRMVVTPCILTEASNLIRQNPRRRELLASVTFQFPLLDERFLPSVEIANTPAFIPLGLTDAGIVALARDRWLVLTVDLDLWRMLQAEGLDVVNFHHLRLS